MLPSELRGEPLLRSSGPLSYLAGGGDMCIILCSHEPGRLAAAAGTKVEDMSIALAVPDKGSDLNVQIVAIRFPDVATERLIPIRLEAGGHSGPPEGDPPPRVTKLQAGSESVTLVEWMWWFPEAGQGEYLYARDDVLFLISGQYPKDGSAPPDVALAVEALAGT